MTALVPDVQFCNVRGHYCRCDERCDAESFPLGHFRPTMMCEHCKTEGDLYEWLPHCRECADVVCESCGTDYDAETNRLTCKRCAKVTHG